jgi:hypothetical protein
MTDERLVELGFTRAPPPFNARAAPPRGAGMPSIVFIAAGGRRRQAARQLPPHARANSLQSKRR